MAKKSTPKNKQPKKEAAVTAQKEAPVPVAPRAESADTKLRRILAKAYMGGLIKSIKLGKNGAFEVPDDSKNVLVIFNGLEDDGADFFSEEIGIIDLGMLVNILKTTTDPMIKYKDGVLTIKEGTKEFKYLTAEPTVVSSYTPATGTEHLEVRIAKTKAVDVTITPEELQNILKACIILKDASRMHIGEKDKGMCVVVGTEQENSYEIQLGVPPAFDGWIALPKRETQAVLEACEGPVTLELRAGDDAPVVVKEKDLKIFIGRM